MLTSNCRVCWQTLIAKQICRMLPIRANLYTRIPKKKIENRLQNCYKGA